MLMQTERPNCTPCDHCGRCKGCGIGLVINRYRDATHCPLCRRYTDNGMTRTPSFAFFDAIQSGAILMRRKGLAIIA